MAKIKRNAEAEKPLDGTFNIKGMAEALVEIQDTQSIDTATVHKLLEEALLKAYKDWWCKANGFSISGDKEWSTKNLSELLAEISIDWDKGSIQLYDCKRVVNDDDITDDFLEISPEDAAAAYHEKGLDQQPDYVAPKEGDIFRMPVEPQTLDQSYIRKAMSYFHQSLRQEANRKIQDEFGGLIGQILVGHILHNQSGEDRTQKYGYDIDFTTPGRITGHLGPHDLIPDEILNENENIAVCLMGIRTNKAATSELEVTRSKPAFVEALFKQEVPELNDGTVVIKGIARIAGIRTKILVKSNNPMVDPVGAMLGADSVRYRAVQKKLTYMTSKSNSEHESVDVLPYSEDPDLRIVYSLAPAKVIGLYRTGEMVARDIFDRKSKQKVSASREKVIAVIESDRDRRVAVGLKGSNVRLASQLNNVEISIVAADSDEAAQYPYLTVEQLKARAEQEKRAKEEEKKAQEAVENATVPTVEEEQPKVEETKPVTDESPKLEEKPAENVVVEEKPSVEPTIKVEERIPVKEEEPVEHVTITGHSKINISALEEQVDKERSHRNSQPSKSWKKKHEDKKKDKKAEETAQQPANNVQAMPIYTPEELREQEMDEEEDDEYEGKYDESDLDKYDDDSYYDDEK